LIPFTLAPPRDRIERLVLAEQAGMVFDRSRSSNWLSPFVALLIAWVLWPALPPEPIVAWVLAKIAVVLLRAWLTRRYDRCRDDPAAVLREGHRFEWVLFLDGLVFGALGTWLLPPGDPVLQITMICTLLGIAGAALVVLSMSLRATLAITLPLLVPAMVAQLLSGNPVGLYAGIGMAVFVFLIAVEGRRASAHTRAMLRLRHRMDELGAQRQQALDLAQRSSEVKSRFLATMSHEVRTPLHGVLGLTQLLREEATQDGPAAHARRAHRLGTLQRAGEHLLGVINDVLDISRIESGRLELEPRPLDLRRVLAESAELVRVSAAAKGLALELSNFDGPCHVLGDDARLRQLLLNLLGNAVKFTPAGRVCLRAQCPADGRQRIEIEDTGPGVPAADRERIFEPFEQVDGSFSRQHGGTGLGLAIARRLAHAMGGSLVCQQAPGGGALFVLHLALPPSAAPKPPPEAASPPAPAPAIGSFAPQAQVLLAEDNPVNAILASTWLERLGLRVRWVENGESAVREAQSGAFDLVLMDCQMPGLDGFGATERLREHERLHGGLSRLGGRLPIVALTANALEGDRERSLAAGMDEHLAKPFDETRLAAVLERHLLPAPIRPDPR
jgi:signal transduction histidine kinase/ActR/RegA family two-component response regulator